MFRPLLLLTLAAAPLVAGSAFADVYKYTDEKGNTQYTDKPPSLPAERLSVKSQRTDVVAVQERQKQEQQAFTKSDESRRKAAEQRNDQRATQEANAKDKAERCAKARERYDRYMNTRRLFEEGKDGERRYLDANEIDAARASAKASMEVMCQ
ncbi:MAG TPA: DUF4124 domain-containing protein [Steroidobacter sp.]|uniref:DUF4124 domain-containing protein n=1 Tax=Steroidobacter sp. TaxID=1978227 RepID=UPI002ED9124B